MKKLLEKELRTTAEQSGSTVTALVHDLEPIIEEIRLHGISRASGSLTPGINGFSAPVFDHTGHMIAAVTSLGSFGNFDTEWDSPLAFAIKEAAKILSARLGHSEASVSPQSHVLASIAR